MKRLLLGGCFLLVATGAFAQAPVVSSVVNAASYAKTGMPNAGIAQGSVFIIFGSNMGPATPFGPVLPLQPTLAGSAINLVSGGSTVQVLPLITSAGQIAAVLPSATPVGTGSLSVVYNGAASAPIPVQVVQNSFGALTLSQSGAGTALITDGNFQVITALKPAVPNQTVILWGTGLGPITTGETQPPPAVNMTQVPVEVYVGTAKANVVYKGRAGCCVGLDQINFTIPPGQLGCNVSGAVKINSIVSNFVSMPVSTGGTCSDPNGLNSGVWDLLVSQGSVNLGNISLAKTTTQTVSGNVLSENGLASFDHVSLNSLLLSEGVFNQTSIGSCVVGQFSGTATAPQPPLFSYTPLDAGTGITISGGPGVARTIAKPSQIPGGEYGSILSLPPFFANTTFTVSNLGGADIGPIQGTVTGSSITWTNANSIINIDRSQDLLITWQGGSGSDFVTISGNARTSTTDSAVGASFSCWAPVNAGQFLVPAAVLLSLPSSNVPGNLTVGSKVVSTFSARGLDHSKLVYSDGTAKVVSYQ